MYYNNNFSRNRSSIRHGGGFSGGFKRPARPADGPSRRPFRGGAHESKLIGQVDIFIKKSSPVAEIVSEQIVQSFSDFQISDYLKVNIQNKGYTIPTPIQSQAIPSILAGRDLIGLANTGTGKTAAFLIPIINKIFRDRREKAFIVTPTRELAVQINDELRSFSANMSIYSALLIGGSNMYRQISDIRRKPSVVIGTPGRIKDLME